MSQITKLLAIAASEDRFSPGEEYWHIPFSLISTGSKTSVVSLEEIKVQGRPLPREKVRFQEGSFRGLPVVPVGRYLPGEEVREWQQTRLLSEKGQRISLVALGRFSGFNNKLSLLAGKVAALQKSSNEMTLPASLCDSREGDTFLLEVRFRDRFKNSCGFELSITVNSLPGYPASQQWVGGDLHIHSLYSDGQRSLSQLRRLMQERGYRFIYLSDGHHTKKLLDDDWQEYSREVLKNSGEKISLFPGVETAAGTPGDEKGHLLVFGTNRSIAGLEENSRGPQEMVDAARGKEPSAPSFPAISHPLGIYRWKDFSVFGHRGMEVMSGPVQLSFGLAGGPSWLWRKEILRHQDRALARGDFPSPLTGTDWHGYWFEPLRGYVTWTRLTANWDELDYPGRKKAVDQSLFAGRVVASRRGSLGFFRLEGREVGSLLRKVPAGARLSLQVEFQPASRGPTHVYVMRGNLEEILFRRGGFFLPGQILRWQDTLTFPGGRQFYWLYAAGADYLYSSPVFVSED